MICDRLFDRRFDNTKFLQATGAYAFESPETGLDRCLREFLEKPDFRVNRQFAEMDRMTGERLELSKIPGTKQKCKYLALRYLPKDMIYDLRGILKKYR